MKLHLDFETRSTLNLKKVGAWAYASHPSTEILCMGVAEHGGAVQVLHGPVDAWIVPGVAGAHITAHNAIFEYAVYNLILHRRYGWPARWAPSLWSCTMARAAMCGLPLSLDELGRVIGVKTPKDLEGRRIMLQLCKPIGVNALGEPVYDETPAKFARLYSYNAVDVKTEMEADALLPEMSASERRIWEEDLIINRRGIQIDTAFCRAGARMSKALVGPLNARLSVLTGGAVDSATQVPALKRYLVSQGVEVPYRYVAGEKKETLDRVGVTELMNNPAVPPLVKSVVEIRRQVSKTTSTAKFEKALEMVCKDGRVRGALQYHGAHTGRWAGRLLQAHNFPQGYGAELDGSTPEQDLALQLILAEDLDVFQLTYGARTMDAMSDALRGMIVAAESKVLVSADYNAIEARGVFWFADEVEALDSYRAGGSPYLDMGAYLYHHAITKKGNPKEYDIAKRTVLGAGFGMGWEKFRDNIYIETAKKGTPLRISDDLAKTAITGYREKYARVPRAWKECEAAAINAVRNPGKAYPACGGKLLYAMSADRRFLVCRLPSGRYLWYWHPAVKIKRTPWGEDKPQLHYWAVELNQWVETSTYGGSLFENAIQGAARDIMANGMLNAEADGLPMILTVHDENLGEADRAAGDDATLLRRMSEAMCRTPEWAAGYPVTVEGWVGPRYRK